MVIHISLRPAVLCAILVALIHMHGGLLRAQNDMMSRDFIYGRSNIYLSASPGISPKPEVTGFNNPYSFNFQPLGRASFKFGVMYQYNFNRSLGITVGIQPALISFRQFRFKYAMSPAIKDLYGLVPDGKCLTCHSLINHTVSFPVMLSYRSRLAERLDLILNAGISLEVGRSFYYEMNGSLYSRTGDSTVHTIRVTLQDRNKRDVIVPHILLGIGINQLLRNNHYISYQFTVDVPTINTLNNGVFVFMPGTPYESSGTFKIRPLVFGLEVNYVFTFKRRKFRTGYLSSNYGAVN